MSSSEALRTARIAAAPAVAAPPADVSAEPAALSDSLFTHPAYRRAHGMAPSLMFTVAGRTALFSGQSGAPTYLGRLDRLTAGEIDALAARVFAETDAPAVVFEDIVLDETGPAATRFHQLRCRYQANWRRAIGPGEKYLPAKKASDVRRRLRRFKEEIGDPQSVRLTFGRARPGDVAAVTRYNRIKVETSGHRHYADAAAEAALERLAGEIGYSCLLHVGEELIGGTIVLVAGRDAYFSLIGYDLGHAKVAPGFQVYMHAIREIEQFGCRNANFLWGDGDWKVGLGATREQLTTVIVQRGPAALASPAHWRGAGPYLVRHVKARLKPVARRLGVWSGPS
ncbi:CelD/BcsL family acetyltransferase involved in cellulose biosynthesis [Rhodobium orientis]|nr:GNAT family N-acetyltransferase [Rhodobium orientis]MBB4303343.1 CelD/BcsL family acetyltransferase involved in cellulose biosynthesis [Rhodobium orientis]